MEEQKKQTEIYAVFSGGIDQQSTQRIMHAIALATQDKSITKFHLMLQSFGGTVGDGICLYNFFKNCPLNLAIYNMGNVASSAAIAFVGARERIGVSSASFMLHPTHISPVAATGARLVSISDSILKDDARIEAVLRESLTFTKEQWSALQSRELWLDAEAALACKLIHTIGVFAPPIGSSIYSITI